MIMLCKNQTWIPSSGAGVNDLTVRLPQKKKKKKKMLQFEAGLFSVADQKTA